MAAERIVSLVPSLTELIVALGRGDRLVGRTRFCTEPHGAVESIPIVGGTKNPVIERIAASDPTLVIANKEENRAEDVAALRAAGLDVLVTDPNTVAEALEMIAGLGERLDARQAAAAIVDGTNAALSAPVSAHSRVAVFIWREPWMVLGSASYGHDLLQRIGAVNVFADLPRYPEASLEEVARRKPDLIFLPDEPYPFKPEHAAELSRIAPARVFDGRLLWWYGPRMPDAVTGLRRLFLSN